MNAAFCAPATVAPAVLPADKSLAGRASRPRLVAGDQPGASVVLITIGATKAAVDAACAVAAAAVGASAGIPVSPPPALVPNVAIMPPG